MPRKLYPRSVLLALALISVSISVAVAADEAQMQRGAALYQQRCLMCHQPTGQGVPPVFPPLAQSNWLTSAADRIRVIQAVCAGLSGRITVNGRDYNNTMPVQMLDDPQVADVLTYVGQSWGNQLAAFTPDEVNAARAKTRFKTYAALLQASAYPPLPQAPAGWTVREVVQLPEFCTRLASRGPGHPVYVMGQGAGVFQVDAANHALIPVIRPEDYGVADLEFFGSTGFTVDGEGRLWVVTNQKITADDGFYDSRIVIWRSSEMREGRPAGMRPWFTTTHPLGVGGFNHGVSHLAFGPDGLLYVSSGSRTDAGEIKDLPHFRQVAEVDTTACLWRLDPKAEQPKIEVIARGLRNAYGFAWDDHGHLFTVSNGPDANPPEEMDFIEPGRHYGFPYQFGSAPATAGSPYPHTPAAPQGLTFTHPVLNVGPAAGGQPAAPLSTFDPHSSPVGMIWCGDDFPAPLRGSFLITRFGNLIACPEDVGFDLLSAKMERLPDGAWQARMTTVLAPLGRPLDVLHTSQDRILLLEYTRPTTNKNNPGWLPGRILELAPETK